MRVVLAGWPGISADLYKDNSGSSLKLSNRLGSFLGRGDLKKQMEAETARRRRPRRSLTPLEGREASAAKNCEIHLANVYFHSIKSFIQVELFT